MPTLSAYGVSVTVGGQSSAIIDWQKYINVLQKLITKYIQWNLSNMNTLGTKNNCPD